MWRVVQWVRTQDHRWAIGRLSEHPDNEIRCALAVARDWTKHADDAIERGRVRIVVQRHTAIANARNERHQ